MNAAEKDSILTLCLMAALAAVNLDKMILNNAILNNTLELLPGSLATHDNYCTAPDEVVYGLGKRYSGGRAGKVDVRIELSLPHATTLRI